MATIYSNKVKRRARDLRRKGWSLGEISRKIGIPKNTLSGWFKGIRLTQKQKKRIKKKITECGAIGRSLGVKTNRKK
jgi:transcriptional regulator with XRE-family HTH domain